LDVLKDKIVDFLDKNNIIEETKDYINSIFNEIDRLLDSCVIENNNILDLINFIRTRKS